MRNLIYGKIKKFLTETLPPVDKFQLLFNSVVVLLNTMGILNQVRLWEESEIITVLPFMSGFIVILLLISIYNSKVEL